jgi:ABC-2 type transport system permease protein
MLWQVIKFELKYRFNRPATYIYFALWFLLAFLAIACSSFIQVGGAIGKVKVNASLTLFNYAGIFSLIPGLFIASAVMGVPILRDFEHKMESLIFTTNISKTSYLVGRFLGSFIILLLISSSFIWGTWLGCEMPWIDHTKFLPVTLAQSAWPWLIMIAFNMFICSCVFFASGALSRKMLFVYLQAIILMAIYFGVSTFIGDMENIRKAAIWDPFGLNTVDALTRYWTVAEKNTFSVPFTDLLLINRIVWTGVGCVFFAIAFFTFKFRAVYTSLFKRKKLKDNAKVVADNRPIPFSTPTYTFTTWFQQVAALSRLYFKEVIRSVPFIGIGIVGLVLVGINAAYGTSWDGQSLYPLTSNIAGYIANQVQLIVIIIILFYSGEIVWRESEIRFNQIFDSLPTSYAVPIVSKFLALAGVMLVYILFMIPVGVFMQLVMGFPHIELGVYLKVFLLRMYIPALIFITITVFIQSMFSNKFIGYAACVLFYIYLMVSGSMKIFYSLLIPNSGSLGPYSDMNGFAADLGRYTVLKIFWGAFGGILLSVAVLFYQRGTDVAFKSRMKNAGQRFGMPQRIFLTVCLVVLVASGSLYYINTDVWNKYINPEELKDIQANYEKTLKHTYGKTAQPSVVNIKCNVDLFPKTGNLNLQAKVTYKNLMHQPISLILVQEPNDLSLSTNLKFSVPIIKVKDYPELLFTVYKLVQPLQPGDSLFLNVTTKRVQNGFTNDGANTSYVANGTFINNLDIFPQLGYQTGNELDDNDDRKKRGLKDQDGLPPRTDTTARMLNLFGQRGRTALDIIVSTDPDQIAISPGYLKNKWMQNGRAYFHYQMDKPIFDFFNIISGRYLVKRDKWKNINLEIYYHEGHEFNLDIMFTALKRGLEYDSLNFSPYLYKQMRIIEFPKYRSFAQSFPNTVPFSENIGFIFHHQPDKLDMCYYVTAHELGHQWWAHQVCEANTQGNQMYSEGLAQYSALMLLKKTLPAEELRRYLKYELDGYLQGRASEKKFENPLDHTDNQQYIHYQKASLVYFAMQDYIGEDNLNKALRKLIANYGNGDKYPTSDVLVGYIKEVTPDSLKYVVDDLFSKITLFDNHVVEPTAKKVKDGYEVTIPIQTVKYYADKSGNEKETPIKDYIDVGVFSLDKNGKEKLVYLKREKFTQAKTTVTVKVKDLPEKAGVDPLYKLVDRNTDDNTAQVVMQ